MSKQTEYEYLMELEYDRSLHLRMTSRSIQSAPGAVAQSLFARGVRLTEGRNMKEKACKTCVHRLDDHDEVPCDSCDDKSEWQQAPERDSTYRQREKIIVGDDNKTLAVEFMKGFLAKEKTINAKQRKHSQIPK